jgi:hypothetical protein
MVHMAMKVERQFVTPRFYKKRKGNFLNFHVTLLTYQSLILATDYI